MSRPHSTQSAVAGFPTTTAAALSRPHTISAAFSAQHGDHHASGSSRPQITATTFVAPEANSVPVSPSKQQQPRANASLFEQSYSTIKRVYR